MDPIRVYWQQDPAPGGTATEAPPSEPAPPPPSPAPAPDVQNQLLLEQIKNARLQAQIDYPKADFELLSMFSGTPDEIRAFAEKSHSKAAAAPPIVVNNNQPGPTPAPGPGAPPTEDQGSIELRNFKRQLNGPGRKRLDPDDVEEAVGTQGGMPGVLWAEAWNKHATALKAARAR